MNILIVGGAGYIGSMLLYELVKRGHKVTVYDNLKYGQKSLSRVEEVLDGKVKFEDMFDKEYKIKTKYKYFDFIVGNTFDKKLLEKVFEKKFDFVFHFGELVGISICDRNPNFTENINFVGTKNVVDLCEKYGSILVYNSSSSVYGYQEKNELLSENAKLPEPTDEYCKNKLRVENYVKTKNLRCVMFRPSTVGGISFRMRMMLMPHDFAYALLVNKKFTLSNPDHYRAMVHIDDMMRGYLLLLDNKEKIKKHIYNIGNDDLNLTKREFLKLVENNVENPEYVIELKEGKGDVRNVRVSSTKFSKEFGYVPKNDFNDMVKPVLSLFKKNPHVFDSYEYFNEPVLWKDLMN